MDILLAGNGPSLWRVAHRRDVQRHYLWKSFRDQAEHYSGAGRKVFGFRPESCSPSARNRVRDQPGTLFGFTPESRSPSPGIRRTPGPVSLDDDTVETVMYKNQEACKELREGFRRSPPLMFWLDTNIIGPGDRSNQPARAYRFLLPRLGISSA
jgi:hypothetical protein